MIILCEEEQNTYTGADVGRGYGSLIGRIGGLSLAVPITAATGIHPLLTTMPLIGAGRYIGGKIGGLLGNKNRKIDKNSKRDRIGVLLSPDSSKINLATSLIPGVNAVVPSDLITRLYKNPAKDLGYGKVGQIGGAFSPVIAGMFKPQGDK